MLSSKPSSKQRLECLKKFPALPLQWHSTPHFMASGQLRTLVPHSRKFSTDAFQLPINHHHTDPMFCERGNTASPFSQMIRSWPVLASMMTADLSWDIQPQLLVCSAARLFAVPATFVTSLLTSVNSPTYSSAASSAASTFQ